MARVETLFATKIYRAEIAATARGRQLATETRSACAVIARDDRAGQAWCRRHKYRGYTSYASLNDLTLRSPEIADLVAVIDGHVARLARQLDLDLGRRRLACNSIWINVLAPGGHHAAHIHPHSAISGTYYVDLPPGASAIRFEDPRLGLMMAAPPRKSTARRASRTFVGIAPKAGTLLLWESWLRHEVPENGGHAPRVSISFNYS